MSSFKKLALIGGMLLVFSCVQAQECPQNKKHEYPQDAPSDPKKAQKKTMKESNKMDKQDMDDRHKQQEKEYKAVNKKNKKGKAAPTFQGPEKE